MSPILESARYNRHSKHARIVQVQRDKDETYIGKERLNWGLGFLSSSTC